MNTHASNSVAERTEPMLHRWRIKDLDGGNNVIVVRDGKGGEDRRVMFPEV